MGKKQFSGTLSKLLRSLVLFLRTEGLKTAVITAMVIGGCLIAILISINFTAFLDSILF